MKSLPIVVTNSAAKAIEEASEWWLENRPEARNALADELTRALALISIQPGIGARARNIGLPNVRRVLLSRVRYHLYYRVAPSGTQIEVLAFWHTSRGSLPEVSPEEGG